MLGWCWWQSGSQSASIPRADQGFQFSSLLSSSSSLAVAVTLTLMRQWSLHQHHCHQQDPISSFACIKENLQTCRRSHLKIPSGSKMARASLSRRAIDGPFAIRRAGRACLLFGHLWIFRVFVLFSSVKYCTGTVGLKICQNNAYLEFN